MKPLRSGNTFIRRAKELILCASSATLFVLLLLEMFCSPGMGPHSRTRVLYNGRTIYQAILSYDLDQILSSDAVNPWPVKNSEHYEASSTAYFTWLMSPETEVMEQDFHLFWGPDVPKVEDPDRKSSFLDQYRERPSPTLELFQSEHNAWSVVADVDKTSNSRMPFLVTRNLNESRLVDWQGTRQNELEYLGSRKRGGYVTPFGDSLVVIRVGGGGETITNPNLIWENLNPDSADNAILEP